MKIKIEAAQVHHQKFRSLKPGDVFASVLLPKMIYMRVVGSEGETDAVHLASGEIIAFREEEEVINLEHELIVRDKS